MSETMDTEALGKNCRCFKNIYDPEIPVDIYELGLIYDVFVNEDSGCQNFNDLNHTQLPCGRITSHGSGRKSKSLR